MAYVEFLITCKVFDFVEVGFFLVGHTREDIYQALSKTSACLSSNTQLRWMISTPSSYMLTKEIQKFSI